MIFPQYIVLFHYFRELIAAANEKDIEIIPLKGAHLLTSVYPTDENRGLLADVDFLVKEADWHKIITLMMDLGYVRRVSSSRKVSDNRFYETGFIISPGNGPDFLFEPHRQLVQYARHPIDYNSLWKRSVFSHFEGVPCRRMTGEDHFLHLIIHLFTHRFTGLMRTFRDLELLIRHGNVDLEIVISRAREWKCTNALWLTLTLMEEHFSNTNFPSDIAAAIPRVAPSALIQRCLRTLVSIEKEYILSGSGLRLEELILWPFLTDDIRQGTRFLVDYVKLRTEDAIHNLLTHEPYR